MQWRAIKEWERRNKAREAEEQARNGGRARFLGVEMLGGQQLVQDWGRWGVRLARGRATAARRFGSTELASSLHANSLGQINHDEMFL